MTTPLAPGWTEHRAPTGQFYYYNAASKESTYVRPTLASTSAPPPPTSAPAPKKKKEKPKLKEPIPNTTWIKVTTTDDNVFYTNTETKASVWTVPDELKDALKEWDVQKKKEAEEEARRVLEEVEREAKEAAEAKEKAMKEAEAEAAARGAKRKADSAPSDKPSDLPADDQPAKPKKKKTQRVGAMEDLDEDWQRQIAEEMAKEAEEEMEVDGAGEEGAAKAPGGEKMATKPKQSHIGAGMTSEETKAMFKAMLMEKDIDPMAPWDSELPKFVTDPRYTAVKAMKERRDLFDEHCKHKIRERRVAKQAAETAGKLDPAAAFRDLLQTHVTSTRTHFADFRLLHKKDARFKNYGRDDRDREKAFKAWLRELGERKRGEMKVKEEAYEKLLDAEFGVARVEWVEVKDRLKGKAEWEAIPSGTLKQELFDKWSKRSRGVATGSGEAGEVSESVEDRKVKDKKEKQEASLKARAEQVRKEKEVSEREAGKSRMALGREEGEREFGALLVDAVRDHDVEWNAIRPSLERDPRYHASTTLTPHDKHRLFAAHLSNLHSKRLGSLEALFAQLAPSLATPFPQISVELADKPQVLKLGPEGSPHRLEELFNSWQRRRMVDAKAAFESLLSESSFVEFWGRMRKAAQDKAKEHEAQKVLDGDKEEAEDGEDEGDGEDGGVVDLKEMARGVDLAEVEKVLKKDKRWEALDHVSEIREGWVRAYLENLAAPSLTVFQR